MTITDKQVEAAYHAYWKAALSVEPGGIESMRAALEAADAAAWETMETAPNEGVVLVFDHRSKRSVYERLADGDWWRHRRESSPTHWRPLHAFPKGE